MSTLYACKGNREFKLFQELGIRRKGIIVQRITVQ